MSFSTPAEIVAQAERAALNKILLSFPRTLVAAMLAGIYIAMGGLPYSSDTDFPNGQQEIRGYKNYCQVACSLWDLSWSF